MCKHCAHQVGGLALVSPRREIDAYLRWPGNPNAMSFMLTMEPDNPYRGLTRHEVAELAGRITEDDPAIGWYVDELDKIWFDVLPERHIPRAQATLRQARRDLRLPLDREL